MIKAAWVHAIILIICACYAQGNPVVQDPSSDSWMGNAQTNEICYSTEAHNRFQAIALTDDLIPQPNMLWLFAMNAAQSQLNMARQIRNSHSMTREYAPTALVTAAYMLKFLQQISGYSFEEVAVLLSLAASSYSEFLGEQLPDLPFNDKYLSQSETVLEEMQAAQANPDGYSIVNAARSSIGAAAYALTKSEQHTDELLSVFDVACTHAFGTNSPKSIPAMQASSLASVKELLWGNVSDNICERAEKVLATKIGNNDLHAEATGWKQLMAAIENQVLLNSSSYKKIAKVGAVTAELYNKPFMSAQNPWEILKILGNKNEEKLPAYLTLMSINRVIGLYGAHMQYKKNQEAIVHAKNSLNFCSTMRDQLEAYKVSMQQEAQNMCYLTELNPLATSSIHNSMSHLVSAKENEVRSLAAFELFSQEALQQAEQQFFATTAIYALSWARLSTFTIKSIEALKALKPIASACDKWTPVVALILTAPKVAQGIQSGWDASQIEAIASQLQRTYSIQNDTELHKAELAAIAEFIVSMQHPYWDYIGAGVEAIKDIRLLLIGALNFKVAELMHARLIHGRPEAQISAVMIQGALVAALQLINYFVPVISTTIDMGEDISLQQKSAEKARLLSNLKTGSLLNSKEELDVVELSNLVSVEEYKELEREVLEKLPCNIDISPKEIQQLVGIDLALKLIGSDADLAMYSLVEHWEADPQSARKFLRPFGISESDLDAMEQSLARPQDVVKLLKKRLSL